MQHTGGLLSRSLTSHARPVPSLQPQYSLNPIKYQDYSIISDKLSSKPEFLDAKDVQRASTPKLENRSRLDDNTAPPWLRGNVSKGFWDDRSNHRLYLDWLGNLLSFKSREDWYRVTLDDFERNRGKPLLLYHYHNSPSLAVSSVYSDHEYLPWIFAKTSSGFFSSRANRRRYVDWLVKKCGVAKPGDLRQTDYHKNHGGGLMQLYGGSPSAVIESLQSDSADALRVEKKPKEFWASVENQRTLLDSIGAKFGANKSDLSPWYKVDQTFLRKLGFPPGLASSYGSSYYAMLRSVYPEHDWIPWKFRILPRNVVNDPDIILKALSYVEKERKMARPEDWYQVSLPVLRDLGVAQIFAKVGGLYESLKKYRRNTPWDEDKFIGVRVSGERALGSYLRKLWPSPSIMRDYELSEGIKATYYLPHIRLAFDYQTANRYTLGNKVGKTKLELVEDSVKLSTSQKLGIRLISIPFWWDRTYESLVATIIESGIELETNPELVRLKGNGNAAISKTTMAELSNWRKFVNLSSE